MTLHYDGHGVTVWHGDSLDVLATLDPCSVDAVVTDPPYSLGFMGRTWDSHADANEDAALCYWFTGFVDGEGCFRVQRHERGTYTCAFTIKVRRDERGTLERMRRYLGGIGTLRDGEGTGNAHPQVTWTVQNKADCMRLVELFDKYPLRAKKRLDYQPWADAVIEWNTMRRGHRWTGRADWSRMATLKARVEAAREYVDPPWSGHGFQDWCRLWAAECLRVLKPGGHLLAFGGTRTWHRLACGIEDAGFEIRDNLAWMYGSGFSKSWNFKTQYQGAWCECGNAIPCDHASRVDLHGLRQDIHTPTIARETGEGAYLLPSVQRGEPRPGLGDARAQGPSCMVPGCASVSVREDARRPQPGMDGGHLHRAGQGLPNGQDAGSPESPSEWVCCGAPAGHGVDHRSSGDAARGSASHQRGPGGQPTGEPETLPGPYGALDDGALRDGPVCSRCGGLDPFYRGAGTGLKPAYEPIVLARKPLAGTGTVAGNVLGTGTGALNIDGCRIGTDGGTAGAGRGPAGDIYGDGINGAFGQRVPGLGRWPANVVLDETAAAMLDEQSGTSESRTGGTTTNALGEMNDDAWQARALPRTGHSDSGGASRFFYTAKADAVERPRVNGVAHATVKPLDLMRWLVRLVTPPDGLVLDPFAGSGTTVEACLLEGVRCVAIEREADYLPLIEARITRQRDPVAHTRLVGSAEPTLFDEEPA